MMHLPVILLFYLQNYSIARLVNLKYVAFKIHVFSVMRGPVQNPLKTLTIRRPRLIIVRYDMGRKEINQMTEEILLTKEGYDKIVEEHEELVAVRRAEVAEKLKEAIAQGDISENADYDAAKNEQAELEERIQKLENMIRKAKIIDESELAGDQVTVGLTVKVQDMDTKEEEEFTIVGSTEADPFEGRISNESLVGQALLGKKAGEEVAVEVPDGIINYKIIEISK